MRFESVETFRRWHCHLRNVSTLSISRSLLMPTGRTVDATRAIGGGTAPDALVCTGTVTMRPIRAIDAAPAVTGRTAPLAMLLVITMLMRPIRSIHTSTTIARRSTMPALRRHIQSSCLHFQGTVPNKNMITGTFPQVSVVRPIHYTRYHPIDMVNHSPCRVRE